MHKPRAVIFDLGKVLLDFDFSHAVRKLAARGKASPGEIHRHVNQTPLLKGLETGLITTAEFFEQVRGITSFDGDFDEFREIFGDIFQPMDDIIAIQAQIRASGIPCYIFSNTSDLHIGYIRERYPFFANFDGYIYSYEHRSMKPHHRIYEVVEETSGFKEADLLYIDDRPENIEAGAKRGWQVILQEDSAKTIEAMRKLGLVPQSN